MPKITGPIRGWHFACNDRKLYQARESHDRIIEVVPGLTLGEPRRRIEPCWHGLHASVHPLDALGYARGSYVSRVELRGLIIPHNNDKLCASWRRHLWCADADAVLREFARWCALQVIHLWDCPDVVRRYLETGDESLRDAAWDAAWAAAWATAAARAAMTAAMTAARTAAWSADAATTTSSASAGAAAWATAAAATRAAKDATRAAKDATRDAKDAAGDARDAAGDAQNNKLTELLMTLAPESYEEAA